MVNRMNELKHHGIKGQKWGVRRFQNEDGSLTEAGRKRYGIETKKSDGTVMTKEELTSIVKSEAIKRADATFANRYKYEFTNEELSALRSRYDTYRRVSEIDPESIKRGKASLEKVANNLQNIVKVTTSGIAIYNNAARVANVFFDKNLPIVANPQPQNKKQGK